MAKRRKVYSGSNPDAADYDGGITRRQKRNIIYLIRRSILFKRHVPVNDSLPDLVPSKAGHIMVSSNTWEIDN